MKYLPNAKLALASLTFFLRIGNATWRFILIAFIPIATTIFQGFDMANHPNRSKQCRPREYLRSLGKTYPDVWNFFEEPRQNRGKNGTPNWPDWCYCPLSSAADIIQHFVEAEKVSVDSIWDIAILGALAAWRVGQGIYRFDPDLFDSIIDTPINHLPIEVLFHLPEWCVYIETPNLQWFSHTLAGVFVHLEWDVKTERPELRLLLDINEEERIDPVRNESSAAAAQYFNLVALPIHLTAPTLDLAIEAMIEEAKQHGMVESSSPDLSQELARSLEPIINLVLYLCTANADFGGAERPTYPRPTKTKKGWRLFPPDRPRTWAMGVRIGAALRDAKIGRQTDQNDSSLTEAGRSRPGPHIRRSHWHTYRFGEGRTESKLKWLPPIPINVDNPDALPASLHSVFSSDSKER